MSAKGGKRSLANSYRPRSACPILWSVQRSSSETHRPFTYAAHLVGVWPKENAAKGEWKVDLNYLFFRQQVERSRAEAAATEPAREAHVELAKRYEEQIELVTPAEFSFPLND